MIRLQQLGSSSQQGFVAGVNLTDPSVLIISFPPFLSLALSFSPPVQRGRRGALWLPGREGVTERGGGHSVPQADPGWGLLPALQANSSLRPEGTASASGQKVKEKKKKKWNVLITLRFCLFELFSLLLKWASQMAFSVRIFCCSLLRSCSAPCNFTPSRLLRSLWN